MPLATPPRLRLAAADQQKGREEVCNPPILIAASFYTCPPQNSIGPTCKHRCCFLSGCVTFQGSATAADAAEDGEGHEVEAKPPPWQAAFDEAKAKSTTEAEEQASTS
eukprot:1090530-Pleurochrysis_carterae.AAC.1